MDLQLSGRIITIDADDARSNKGGYFVAASSLSVSLPIIPVRYLYSGWQSWSLIAWIGSSLHLMRPKGLLPMQTDPVYADETHPHGSWYGAVELPDGEIVFLGALGLESHVFLEG